MYGVFPSVAAQNGGGAFLIPYLIVLLFIGRPLYYLEMCLGQFSKYGQVKVWNMAPIFKGIGYGSITGVICLCTYYCSLIAITVYFLLCKFCKKYCHGLGVIRINMKRFYAIVRRRREAWQLCIMSMFRRFIFV